MNPAARSSAVSAWTHAESGPRTETKTFAWRRSFEVSTSVTVTKPIRGSLSSRRMMSAISSRRRGLIRSIRFPCIVIQGVVRRASRALQDLDPIVDDRSVEQGLDHVHGLRNLLVGVARIVRNAGDPERGALPGIVLIHLRDRDIEPALDLLLEPLQDVTLFFEGSDPREM